MKTVDHKVRPFTASYQAIDEDNEIYAFTLQDISPQIERQENVSTSDDEKNNFRKKMKETDF